MKSIWTDLLKTALGQNENDTQVEDIYTGDDEKTDNSFLIASGVAVLILFALFYFITTQKVT